MQLSQQSCKACQGQEQQLATAEIQELLTKLKDWQLSADQKWLVKEFKFSDFAKTLDFVNQISQIAEQEFHHPNFEFTWGYCKISIQTHKVDGLCKSDFILAAKIDDLQ